MTTRRRAPSLRQLSEIMDADILTWLHDIGPVSVFNVDNNLHRLMLAFVLLCSWKESLGQVRIMTCDTILSCSNHSIDNVFAQQRQICRLI